MSFEQKFDYWIEKINTSENPIAEIKAFNFGLLETPNGYALYVIGSKTFDSEDDDWACNEDFEPKNKYLEFPSEFNEDKSWEEILEISVNLVKNYIKSDRFKDSIFNKAEAITAGFDDGDLKRIL